MERAAFGKLYIGSIFPLATGRLTAKKKLKMKEYR